MTKRQRAALKAWRIAQRAYYIATNGERRHAWERFKKAATEKIAADVEAMNAKKEMAA